MEVMAAMFKNPGSRTASGGSLVREERGAAAVEFLLVVPALLLTFLLLVQWAVRLETVQVVQAAAREGAQSAAAWNGSETDGKATATRYLAQGAADVSAQQIQVHRGITTVTVTVEGNALTMIPGLPVHVTSTQTAPVERFVP